MTRYIFALALLPVVVFPQSKQQSPSTLTTYTSDALGFSYTYPLQLIPNTGDFRRKLTTHVSDQPTSSVLFSAFETPVPGKPREGVVITAEDVGVYGGKVEPVDYLRKVTTALSAQGWTVSRENLISELDRQRFFRSDYQHLTPPMFQSVVCTIRKKSVLEFIFSAGNEQEVNQLLGSLGTIRFLGGDEKAAPH